MPRTAMSRSVIMPMSRSPSVTGIEPASFFSMNLAASCADWSGRMVWKSRVITSLIFMVALLWTRARNERSRTEVATLRHVLGQKVVGRDQLVLLVENLDRPADHARILAFHRFGPDRQLDPHRIVRIERGEEAQILKAGVGENRTRIRVDEQPRGEAQDQIAVGDSPIENGRRLGRFLVHVGVEFVAGELGEMLDILDADGAA